MIRSRMLGLAVALATCAALPLADITPAAAYLPERFPCDFDGNGYNDIAVASRLEEVAGKPRAGIVQVTYVSDGWWLSQKISMAYADKTVENAYFGTALACGDFNDDDRADLAISATGRYDSAGAVYVLYGAVGGLASEHRLPTQVWHQDNVGTDAREHGDLFGSALVSGDFNGDLVDDLAIGVPAETVDAPGGTYLSAGMVHVLRGTDSGLTASGAQTRIGECCWASGRYYGWSLASGDVDSDGRDELAIGLPGATIDTHDGGMFQAGGVEVLQGSSLHFLVEPVWAPEVITQLHVGDGPETYDFFGAAIVMADFDGDEDDDLAIGAPHESDGAVGVAGSVDIVVSDGGLSGFDFGSSYRLTQDTPSMPQSSEVGDQFGSALAAGDFNADRRQDLAIGTLESGTSAQHEMGSFFVLPGTPGELNPGAATMTSWMGEKDARVGAALATGDVTADGRDDLIVGVPGAKVDGLVGAGAVLVYRGQTAATVIDIQPPHVVQIDEALANPDAVNVPVAGEYFGTAVAG